VKKFLTTFAVLTVIATPAFAQSFDPDNGTGNVLQFSHKSNHDAGKIAVHQDAMRAYATAPFEASVGSSNAPQATGGGSAGYNEMLRNY
jgi:hypothetical protein